MNEGKIDSNQISVEKDDKEEIVAHEGWYLFNDSEVSAVPTEEITKKVIFYILFYILFFIFIFKFGGKSECAYMLFYRKKNLEIEKCVAPLQLVKEIEELNKENERKKLKEEKERNEMTFQIYTSEMFEINENNIPILKKSQEEKTIDIHFDKRKTVSELIRSVISKFPEKKDLVLHSVDLRGNSLNFFNCYIGQLIFLIFLIIFYLF